MQKQAPTLGRILVMAGFALSCFGLLLYLWVAFGGGLPLKPKGYRFHVHFGEATQLAQQADVRISGVPVGKVVKLALGPGDTTDATIQLDERYAPIPRDSRAILRQKTLLGETYVELTPGNKRDGLLPENGTAARSRRSRRRSSSTRSSARSTRSRRAPSRSGCSRSRVGIQRARARTSTTRSATSRRSPSDTNDAARVLEPAEPGRPAARAQHRHRLRRAQRSAAAS